MFGSNQIVGKQYFAQAPADSLFVTSLFFTLQGEGPYRGEPAFFIRLAKCNLACSFCDTAFEQGDWCHFDALFTEIDQLIYKFFEQKGLPVPVWASATPKKMVLVVTGGEPSLQNNLSAFLHLATEKFALTQIESNGTSVLPNFPAKTTLVVSPKAYEKNGLAVRYLKPANAMLARADHLKFVMSAPEDKKFAVYSTVPDWAHQWAQSTGKQVFISPMNIYHHNPTHAELSNVSARSEINERVSFWTEGLLDREKNQKNHEYAAEYALVHGFTLNLQIHLYASLP